MERDLFARRARAMEPASVPSLASVLSAVDESRETSAARSAHGRALMTLALAAACMLASITKLPLTETRASIEGENIDASAPRALVAASESTCSLDDEIAASEERACVDPTRLFSATPSSLASRASLTGFAPTAPSATEVTEVPSYECGGPNQSRASDVVCR